LASVTVGNEKTTVAEFHSRVSSFLTLFFIILPGPAFKTPIVIPPQSSCPHNPVSLLAWLNFVTESMALPSFSCCSRPISHQFFYSSAPPVGDLFPLRLMQSFCQFFLNLKDIVSSLLSACNFPACARFILHGGGRRFVNSTFIFTDLTVPAFSSNSSFCLRDASSSSLFLYGTPFLILVPTLLYFRLVGTRSMIQTTTPPQCITNPYFFSFWTASWHGFLLPYPAFYAIPIFVLENEYSRSALFSATHSKFFRFTQLLHALSVRCHV